MNKRSTFTIVTAVVVVLWLALGVLNYNEVKKLEIPTLSWPGSVDESGSVTYFGAGYSFVIEGDIDENGKVTDISSMEMYALGVRIVRAGE